MNFHLAEYKASYGTAAQLPESARPEVVFSGRSNVGKSSLLNKLMYRKGLAKVSSQPGKTATINFFRVGDANHDAAGNLVEEGTGGIDLVDLPGYVFAKVSKAEKKRWADLIDGYFEMDRDFALVVALVDIRHDPSALDRSMIEYLQEAGLPFAIALTKADKLSKQRAISQKARIKKTLKLDKGVPMIVTSAENGVGIEELRALIAEHTGAKLSAGGVDSSTSADSAARDNADEADNATMAETAANTTGKADETDMAAVADDE